MYKKPIFKEYYFNTEALEQQFTFSYSEDGKNWIELAKNQNATIFSFAKGVGRFTGTFVGMYATSNGNKSDNSALFDWFDYSGF